MSNVSQPIRLMIVDDSTTMQKRIASAAQHRKNLEVVATASNGADAIHYFKARKPNLVTMDITMPKLNGILTIERLIAIDDTVKILVISSLNDLNTALRAIEAGGSAFLNKPFSDEEFKAQLKGLGF